MSLCIFDNYNVLNALPNPLIYMTAKNPKCACLKDTTKISHRTLFAQQPWS